MATHSINLARKIPWTEKPGGLQSMRSQKSGTQLKRLSTCERSGAEESCEETTWTPNWNQYCRWKWGHEFKKCYKSKTENTVYFSFLRLLQGEGSGNTLQYSCLENPRDRGAWWAAVHRVAQSRTRLKQPSMHACIGEGSGNPLQCSSLENPRDGGAWWAAVHGVAESDMAEATQQRQQQCCVALLDCIYSWRIFQTFNGHLYFSAFLIPSFITYFSVSFMW